MGRIDPTDTSTAPAWLAFVALMLSPALACLWYLVCMAVWG